MSDKRIIEKIDRELAELAPRYIANVRRDTAFILAAIDSGDLSTAQRLGHSLKGSGRSYGFAGLSDIGAGIERAIAGGLVAEARTLCDAVGAYLARVDIVYVDEE